MEHPKDCAVCAEVDWLENNFQPNEFAPEHRQHHLFDRCLKKVLQREEFSRYDDVGPLKNIGTWYWEYCCGQCENVSALYYGPEESLASLGHLRFLQWVHTITFVCSCRVMQAAVASGNLALLDWISAFNPSPPSENETSKHHYHMFLSVLQIKDKNAQHKTLQWLLQHNILVTDQILSLALEENWTDVVETASRHINGSELWLKLARIDYYYDSNDWKRLFWFAMKTWRKESNLFRVHFSKSRRASADLGFLWALHVIDVLPKDSKEKFIVCSIQTILACKGLIPELIDLIMKLL